ncbi:MAG: hypothetical protein H6513_16715 [Acidimicrobiaceae bacterium]|nr:hypothetical protein [Acidimicrobiaceae bacterium]MCO5330701.1 hypothetical protein [Ilumatobacteraceae bacterium]
MNRLALALLAIIPVAAVACGDGDCCVTTPPLPDTMESAEVVVLADTVEASPGGEVAIRPVLWFKGSLPLDGDGLVRFDWTPLDAESEGVWAFGADGRPVWDSAVAADPNMPSYPWSMENSLVSNALHTVFPELVEQEAARATEASDLIAEVVYDPAFLNTTGDPLDGYTVCVVRVLAGDPMDNGDQLQVLPSAKARIPWSGSFFLALQRDGDQWVETPTWLWSYWEDYLDSRLFPGVDHEFSPQNPRGCP